MRSGWRRGHTCFTDNLMLSERPARRGEFLVRLRWEIPSPLPDFTM